MKKYGMIAVTLSAMAFASMLGLSDVANAATPSVDPATTPTVGASQAVPSALDDSAINDVEAIDDSVDSADIDSMEVETPDVAEVELPEVETPEIH